MVSHVDKVFKTYWERIPVVMLDFVLCGISGGYHSPKMLERNLKGPNFHPDSCSDDEDKENLLETIMLNFTRLYHIVEISVIAFRVQLTGCLNIIPSHPLSRAVSVKQWAHNPCLNKNKQNERSANVFNCGLWPCDALNQHQPALQLFH